MTSIPRLSPSEAPHPKPLRRFYGLRQLTAEVWWSHRALVGSINSELVHERCSYPAPAPPTEPKAEEGSMEFEFRDAFGNRRGRFFRRPKTRGIPEIAWEDAFGRVIDLSEHLTGDDFAIANLFEGSGFAIYRIDPDTTPQRIFKTPEKIEIQGFNPDGTQFLIQQASAGDWFSPHLRVLNLEGRITAECPPVPGSKGCWGGPWSPLNDDPRVIIHHEASGFLQPAIWDLKDNTITDLGLDLEGEVRARWVQDGNALILHRSLLGRSDLHQFDLHSHALQTVQPLDGVVFQFAEKEGRIEGLWSANHAYVQRFVGSERIPNPLFAPSRPLHKWEFQEIAGIPCFIVKPEGQRANGWTVFDVYGDFAYHHSDGYNWKSQILADHGYTIVMVNTRGCGGLGQAWREGSAGKMGFTELEDLDAVRATLVADHRVVPGKLIVTGDSWGGYLTLLALGVQAEHWSVGIAGLPVADFLSLQDETTPILWAVRPNQFSRNPANREEAYRRSSPLTYVDDVSAPLLILAGEQDLLCPLEQSRRYARALVARGRVCELYTFEGGHGAPTREERVRQKIRMLEFLKKYTTGETH